MEAPSNTRSSLGALVAFIMLGGGAILRVSAHELSRVRNTGYITYREWLEESLSDIALALMALGVAIAAVTFHHWLRRGR